MLASPTMGPSAVYSEYESNAIYFGRYGQRNYLEVPTGKECAFKYSLPGEYYYYNVWTSDDGYSDKVTRYSIKGNGFDIGLDNNQVAIATYYSDGTNCGMVRPSFMFRITDMQS